MTLTAEEFLEGRQALERSLRESGRNVGPCYMENGHVPAWHDQYFERGMEPAGSVNCRHALRVGSTNSALDVVLQASPQNAGPLICAAGASITVTYMQADTEDGVYEAVGPSQCITAPASGMEVAPGEILWRFSIGNSARPWLMVNLDFAGTFTGGKADCLLDYNPR